MAKNRRNQAVTVRFGPALKAFALCALIGGAGVGYVWQKSQINELSKTWAQFELLPEADKSKKWEVINAGGISYASYRVARVMEELLEFARAYCKSHCD